MRIIDGVERYSSTEVEEMLKMKPSTLRTYASRFSLGLEPIERTYVVEEIELLRSKQGKAGRPRKHE